MFVAATPFRCWNWCTPGARFFASGMDAAEKTGGVNVKTGVISSRNYRAATLTGPEGVRRKIGVLWGEGECKEKKNSIGGGVGC